MEDTPHHVRLTEDQLQAVKALFDERGWELKVETDEIFRLRKETADAYVVLEPHQRIPSVRTSDRSVSPVQMRPRSIESNGNNSKTYTLDKSQKDLEHMKEIGSTFRKSLKSQRKMPNGTAPQPHTNNWRLSTLTQPTDDDNVDTDLNFTHFVLPNENTIKILTRLSTEHVQTVSRVPVRIVLLVDRSGSMLHKLGRDGRHTKITKVRHFVENLIQSLDEGDEVAMVTFGDEADIIFPLTRLNRQSRDMLKGQLRSLDKGSMSRNTNLSNGLRKALKVFYDATKSNADFLLSTKNSILVFSDGDINAGTTNTNQLISEVRQNIRQMVPALDDSQNQWVTISVINTGSSISEQVYTLSKMCSSEAYYYIDNAAEDPEAELFLPVLLRKTAVAWNISYVIEAFHDVIFIDDKCSRDHRVHLRRSISGRKQQEEKSYFLYDFPAGKTRDFGVYASWRGKKHVAELEDDAVIFKMRVEFTNIQGERYWQEVTINKKEILEAMDDMDNTEASKAALKHEMKLVSGNVLRTAADLLKTGDKRQSRAVILEGQKDLQALMNAFGDESREQMDKKDTKDELHDYAKSVVNNMTKLVETIESASSGAAWNTVRAVSTAITRETPNTTETLMDGNILCPFPSISHMETGGLKDPIERMQAKHKANKRMTFGNLDTLLENELA